MKQELRTLNVSTPAAAKDDAFELHGTAVSYNVLSDVGEDVVRHGGAVEFEGVVLRGGGGADVECSQFLLHRVLRGPLPLCQCAVTATISCLSSGLRKRVCEPAVCPVHTY